MDFSYELSLKSQGYRYIAGVDEAGRGPLAGPVVAAVVVFDHVDVPAQLAALKDSKKLSAGKRARLFDAITSAARAYALGVCDHETIDRVNILQATFMAMHRALAKLGSPPDILLVDGNLPLPRYVGKQQAIVDGDNIIFSIAAASVLAKVARDRIMEAMDERWPQYFFAKHKGYGTALHLNALKLYGPCEIHRKSFRPVKNVCNYSKDQMSNYAKSNLKVKI